MRLQRRERRRGHPPMQGLTAHAGNRFVIHRRQRGVRRFGPLYRRGRLQAGGTEGCAARRHSNPSGSEAPYRWLPAGAANFRLRGSGWTRARRRAQAPPPSSTKPCPSRHMRAECRSQIYRQAPHRHREPTKEAPLRACPPRVTDPSSGLDGKGPGADEQARGADRSAENDILHDVKQRSKYENISGTWRLDKLRYFDAVRGVPRVEMNRRPKLSTYGTPRSLTMGPPAAAVLAAPATSSSFWSPRPHRPRYRRRRGIRR
jgi:hypothetical protein